MRYSHPNKSPKTPMYYWIVRTYEKHRIEHENLLDRSAIHWYELYKEREKYFQATPIKLFWESIKEQFPDAYIDTELLPKTILEVEENNKQLRAENEKLRNTLLEIANSAGEDACSYTTGEGHSDCIWKARKALKEVTNSKTDYKEHLKNMSENEYRRLHEGRWENDENEVTK